MGTKVIRRKHIIQPTGFGTCSSTCCEWDGEDVPAPWERSNSHPPVRVQKSCVNQFIQYNICSRGVFISNSKPRNCVIVAIESFFATIDRCSVMTRMYRWISKSKTQLVKQRKQKVASSPGTALMIMKDSKMPKIEYDLKAIMYSAYDTPHKLCNRSGN